VFARLNHFLISPITRQIDGNVKDRGYITCLPLNLNVMDKRAMLTFGSETKVGDGCSGLKKHTER